ncbi:DEAD/DEAH box helicase [Zhongshania aliphaticivorans]|uniref:DEAD/DEAH box helicase n=1 Tax=Zhongshania aliphaticivorans TaxID=1470434 RepID=UPI0012E67F71|nr:DEAD/DEAH box helicase family protein [Zhongshania aliphaticivorans]CAA0078542.1 Putative DNA repair helicase RadD [Zhongshania aliphaticivorans]
MQLRRWQYEAVEAALTKYETEHPHFLCLATPGAGKTFMASRIAKELMDSGKIDLVFCFSPSVNVATSFQASIESQLKCKLDGLLGSKGRSLTYQSMPSQDLSFWSLLSQYKTLVIFDEIHHCAGDNLDNANVWGQKIIQHIQGEADYTLALSGTPWRSDKVPIALSSYCVGGVIQCDYSYGLERAIQDGVCRIPKIIAVDNDEITLLSGDERERYSSFAELLKQSKCTYQQLLDSSDLITYMIKITAKKINEVRKRQPNSGALVVAATVDHAIKIAEIIKRDTGDSARVVTYLHDGAQDTIRDFREANDKWIVSVGMISEGTDIPRLKVCCHLTRVKTELYFRQVLGRILRSTGVEKDEGFLFIPAEPNLVEYAERVVENIPDANTIAIEQMTGSITTSDNSIQVLTLPEIENDPKPIVNVNFSTELFPDDKGVDLSALTTPTLAETYDTSVGLFGRFKQEIINFAIQDIAFNR